MLAFLLYSHCWHVCIINGAMHDHLSWSHPRCLDTLVYLSVPSCADCLAMSLLVEMYLLFLSFPPTKKRRRENPSEYGFSGTHMVACIVSICACSNQIIMVYFICIDFLPRQMFASGVRLDNFVLTQEEYLALNEKNAVKIRASYCLCKGFLLYFNCTSHPYVYPHGCFMQRLCWVPLSTSSSRFGMHGNLPLCNCLFFQFSMCEFICILSNVWCEPPFNRLPFMCTCLDGACALVCTHNSSGLSFLHSLSPFTGERERGRERDLWIECMHTLRSSSVRAH